MSGSKSKKNAGRNSSWTYISSNKHSFHLRYTKNNNNRWTMDDNGKECMSSWDAQPKDNFTETEQFVLTIPVLHSVRHLEAN